MRENSKKNRIIKCDFHRRAIIEVEIFMDRQRVFFERLMILVSRSQEKKERIAEGLGISIDRLNGLLGIWKKKILIELLAIR